jgi:hypothetical protein
LHADEAFWAGDHAAEGKLKDLVTGHDHFIEYKGKEPVRVQNFVRLLDALESVITIAWTGLITIPGRSIPPHVHSAAESTEVAGQFGGGGTSHAWHCSNKTESADKDFDLTRPVRPPPGCPAAPPESRRRFSRQGALPHAHPWRPLSGCGNTDREFALNVAVQYIAAIKAGRDRVPPATGEAS